MVFTKWDGSLHWHGPADVLGADEHGSWLAVRPGSEWRRGSSGTWRPSRGSVLLVPDGDPYLATFPLHDPDEDVYVDVATVPEWRDSTVRLIDLDLDVLRSHKGTTRLLDEDEFDEHRVAMGYPPQVVELALATAARIRAAVEDRDEPFGTGYLHWQSRIDDPGGETRVLA